MLEFIKKFVRRKAQLYTLFSVIFYMQREKISLKEEHKENLDRFVQMYAVFENDMDLSDKINEKEKQLFDWLKKYKLASSEGLNKHTNRMIRYNVMKDFLFDFSDELKAASTSLLTKMQEQISK